MDQFPINPESITTELERGMKRLVNENPKVFVEAICAGALYFFGKIFFMKQNGGQDGHTPV